MGWALGLFRIHESQKKERREWRKEADVVATYLPELGFLVFLALEVIVACSMLVLAGLGIEWAMWVVNCEFERSWTKICWILKFLTRACTNKETCGHQRFQNPSSRTLLFRVQKKKINKAPIAQNPSSQLPPWFFFCKKKSRHNIFSWHSQNTILKLCFANCFNA